MRDVHNIIRTLLFAGLMAVLLGCSKDSPDSAGSGGQTSEVTSESAGMSTPPPESGGPEPPQQPQRGQPSVDVARLPIGGNADGAGATQCVHVSINGIPKGVLRITIAGVAFDPPGIFNTGGKGCGNQQPLCKELSEQHSSCSLPVVQVKDVSKKVTLTLRGTATCVDKAACTDFEANAKPGSISIDARGGVVGKPSRSTSPPGG